MRFMPLQLKNNNKESCGGFLVPSLIFSGYYCTTTLNFLLYQVFFQKLIRI